MLNKDLLKKTTSKTTLPEATEEVEVLGTTEGTITPDKNKTSTLLVNDVENNIEEPRIVATETAELEKLEEKAVIIPETEKKPLTGDSRRVKSKKEAIKRSLAPLAIAFKDEPPQELIDIPRGTEISQRKLAEITKKGKGTISRWANVAKSRPKWFDEYIKVKTETRKGKSVKVMYRR